MNRIGIVVYDFDGTVIKTVSKNAEPDLKHFIDANWFKQMVLDMVAEGKAVGIATYGWQDRVIRYMNLLFGQNQTIFTKQNVITPPLFSHNSAKKCDVRWKKNKEGSQKEDGGNLRRYEEGEEMLNKVPMLELLRGRYNIARMDQLLFFDDVRFNIDTAKLAGYPNAIWTPRGLAPPPKEEEDDEDDVEWRKPVQPEPASSAENTCAII
jgi:hypothetical protein